MLRVLSAILFDPRGGSADELRSLSRCLGAREVQVRILAGSQPGPGDARKFFGKDVHAVDFGPALARGDPMGFEGRAGTAPMHPSYEDRSGAPDKVFAKLDDPDYERQVRAWGRELLRAGARDADVLHLNHLTPINEAAARVAPDVPVVGHLHGTEMLMLEQIDRGAPASWTYAERWAARLRGWARRCARLVVVPSGAERAERILGVSREVIYPLPGGVDVDQFMPKRVQRQEFWHRVLVAQPRGWLPGEGPGSASYGAEQVARLAAGPVLVYCGRFTAVKRLDVLIGAFGRARRDVPSAGLVLVGGHPGEWEGEHPAECAARLRVPDVYLAGWQTQEALPEFFSAADAVVLASEREHFGLVLVEGMACGLPAVATRALGPASIIEDGETGWLVEVDDERALAAAIAEVISDPDERRRRGRMAVATVRARYSWPAIAAQLADCFAAVVTNDIRQSAPIHGG